MSEQTREYLGSPNFPKTNTGTIAAGASTVFRWDDNASPESKYLPYNFVVVTNTGTDAIKFYVNDETSSYYVDPGGVIRTFDKKSVPGFVSCRIENIGTGTISANKIFVEAQKEVIDGERVIQNVASRMFGGGGV